jgi:hypothetical protein
VAGIQCDADAVAPFSPQKLEEFATILEKEPLDPNWGSGFIFFHFQNACVSLGLWRRRFAAEVWVMRGR